MKNKLIAFFCLSSATVLFNGCGVLDSSSGYRSNGSGNSIANTSENSSPLGSWKLAGIRCDDQESMISVFNDSSILSGSSGISSEINITSNSLQNFRSWTVGTCEMITGMDFSQITSNNFVAADTNVNCFGNCSAFSSSCSAPAGSPINYPYILNSDSMSVEMPLSATSSLCAPGQATQSVKFVYNRKI
jgi:hypothetical protein